ncbi:MAG: hypothetical protein HUU26_05210 [Gemmatimonadaceae bacterium]|nr:hypothetical protein [Gemmatimonadaceae bacterium]
MYSTCLFCNEALGSNEAVEAFPVGRRLAFDQAKGRLWVVCPKCERWNLTPLEERWEAIEQAERLYRDTRRRVATDNVGLARLRDGTTLVRIGEPLRPEFAAWRYGDQFGRRRNRQLLLAAGGLAAVGAVVTGLSAAGIGIGAFGWMIANRGQAIIRGDPERVIAKIHTEAHGLVHVRRRHLNETAIARTDDGRLALDLRFRNGRGRVVGREAERIAAVLLPQVNRYGGNRRAVAEAVDEIEDAGSAEGFIERLSRSAGVAEGHAREWEWSGGVFVMGASWPRRRGRNRGRAGLNALPGPQRLALEMALHEEAERRAMQGELEELERAWREAEEIAGISDTLLVPDSVSSMLDRLKSR